MANEDESGAAKKPPMILTAAVLAAMTALAVGGGWFLGNALAPQEETPAAVVAGAHAEGDEETAAMVPQPVALEPITTNLAYPAERWIRLDISVLFEEPTDPSLARTIHQDILAYMRTVSLQQIEGARGFQHLRADLTERAELRSDGKVSELLFRTFVIE